VRRATAALILLLVASCATSGPGQDLLGVPGLATAIRNAYERNAWERNALCLSPRMGAITEAAIVERTGDVATVRVRYVWRADVMGNERFRRPCQGVDERDFGVRLDGPRPRVVSMTGGQRGA
jgi:hypothetical protein